MLGHNTSRTMKEPTSTYESLTSNTRPPTSNELECYTELHNEKWKKKNPKPHPISTLAKPDSNRQFTKEGNQQISLHTSKAEDLPGREVEPLSAPTYLTLSSEDESYAELININSQPEDQYEQLCELETNSFASQPSHEQLSYLPTSRFQKMNMSANDYEMIKKHDGKLSDSFTTDGEYRLDVSRTNSAQTRTDAAAGNSELKTMISYRKSRCLIIIGSVVLICVLMSALVAGLMFGINLDNHGRDGSGTSKKSLTTVEPEVLDAQLFLNKARLLKDITGNGQIRGITVLNNELFVVQNGSSQVKVYNTDNFTLTRYITITGSVYLWAIRASSQYNSLYISDWAINVIYRYNLSNNVTTKWTVNGTCYGISLTSTHNVLVTLWNKRQIIEYNYDGIFVRAISLHSSIENPWHSLSLSNDTFIVSHGNGPNSLHRVCSVNADGNIIQCYGKAEGRGVGQLSEPRNLAVDGFGNVMVANWWTDKVVLMSSSLTHLGYITVPGHQLSRPYDLHLDQKNHWLYIGEETANGRVLVFSA